MAYLHELPMLPGIILKYTDPQTDRTVHYRINSQGFMENYFYLSAVESSLATILADAMIGEGWDVDNDPPHPAYPTSMVLKDKTNLERAIMTEVVRDMVVDELLTPSV